jgi:hypothetical protein
MDHAEADSDNLTLPPSWRAFFEDVEPDADASGE